MNEISAKSDFYRDEMWLKLTQYFFILIELVANFSNENKEQNMVRFDMVMRIKNVGMMDFSKCN